VLLWLDIKEIEVNVPYRSLDLSFAKITNLCKRLISEKKNVEEIQANKKFNDILAATNDALSFIQMSTLTPEGFKLNCDENDSKEICGNNFAENETFDLESMSSEAGTEDEGTENEDN